MIRRAEHPDQLQLQLEAMSSVERAAFEAAVAAEAERQALRWRFRLVVIESIMMAGLVLVAGLLVEQPDELVIRASITVGIACFVSGLLLIWLSGVTGALMSHWKTRRRRR